MPAWTAVSPGGAPERFSWLDGFPKSEVVLILLAKLIDFSFFSLSVFDSFKFPIFEFGLVLLNVEVN
jgi:hypothetical protein